MKKYIVLFLSLFLTAVFCQGQELTLAQQDSNLIVDLQPLAFQDQRIIDSISSYLANRPAGDTTHHLAEIYNTINSSYVQLGQYAAGLKATNRAIDIHSSLDSVAMDQLSIAYYFKSVVFLKLGHRESGMEYITEAIKAMKKSLAQRPNQKNERFYNGHLIMAANVANYLGDYELSEIYLNAVTEIGGHYLLDLDQNRKFTQQQIEVVRMQREFIKGNYSVGIKEAKQQIASLEEGSGYGKRDAALKISKLRGNIASYYMRMNEMDSARTVLEQGLPAFLAALEESDSSGLDGLSMSYESLIQIAGEEKKAGEIEEHKQKAIKYAEMIIKAGADTRKAMIYLWSAEAYLKCDRLTMAQTNLDSAVYFLVEDPRRINEAGMVRIKNNIIYNSTVLRKVFRTQQEIHHKNYASTGNTDVLSLALLTYPTIDSLSRLDAENMSFAADISTSFESAQVDRDKAIKIARDLASSTQDDQYYEEAWRVATQAKSTLLARFITSTALAELFGVSKDIVEEKTELDLRLIALRDQLEETAKADRKVIQDSLIGVDSRLKTINLELAETHPDFVQTIRGGRKVNLRKVNRQLPSSQALIEYFIGEEEVVIFRIDKRSGLKIYALPLPENFQEAISQAAVNDSTSAFLYDVLIAPVLADLSSSVTRLQIIPDGQLWNLPFAALKKNGRFLIEDYAISYAYSTGLLFDPELRKAVENSRTSFAGFGLSYDAILKKIQGSGSRSTSDRDLLALEGLPYARDEVATIGEITKGDTWLDGKATKNNFLDAIPGYEQLYLAMHGLSDPENPLENALVFASTDTTKKYELLTTREILAQKIPARLAVLSACHTGAGPLEASEGVQSMARAFTFAGVKATLASNWEANDEVTRNIMVRFYEEVRQGKPLDVAQQIATVAYLEQASPAFQKPEFWANLTLTGFTQPVYGNGWPWWMIGGLAALGFAMIWSLLRRTGK